MLLLQPAICYAADSLCPWPSPVARRLCPAAVICLLRVSCHMWSAMHPEACHRHAACSEWHLDSGAGCRDERKHSFEHLSWNAQEEAGRRGSPWASACLCRG